MRFVCPRRCVVCEFCSKEFSSDAIEVRSMTSRFWAFHCQSAFKPLRFTKYTYLGYLTNAVCSKVFLLNLILSMWLDITVQCMLPTACCACAFVDKVKSSAFYYATSFDRWCCSATSAVCQLVCLSLSVCAKTAEWIEVPFGVETPEDPMHTVLYADSPISVRRRESIRLYQMTLDSL